MRPIEKDKVPEPVREVYEDLERRFGRVGNLYKMLGNKPEVLRTFEAFYRTVWAPGALPAKTKVLAYLRASLLNGCAY